MKRLIHLSIILVFFVTNSANAGLLNSIFGYNDDIDRTISKMHGVLEHGRRIAIQSFDKGDSIVEKHLNRIDELEERTAKDIEKIMGEVLPDIDSKIERIDSIMKKFITSADEIEEQIYLDIKESISNIKCTAGEIINGYLPNLLGWFGQIMGANTRPEDPPLLYPGEKLGKYCALGYCLLERDVHRDFKIKNPFSSTHDDIKEYYLDRLSSMREDTPVNSMMLTYSHLSKLSQETFICHHSDMVMYLDEYAYFRGKNMQLQEFVRRQNLVIGDRGLETLTIGECMQSAVEKNNRLALENEAMRRNTEEIFAEALQDVLGISDRCDHAIAAFDQKNIIEDCEKPIGECLHRVIEEGNRLEEKNMVLRKKYEGLHKELGELQGEISIFKRIRD